MSKLNKDILYLIFEEVHDKKTLFSCLLVNKTWCDMIIRNLWRDPWRFLKNRKDELLLLNIIISYLSVESKNYLKSQGINIFTKSCDKPLYNYITFCKHLNLNAIGMILVKTIKCEPKISIILNEIFNLFINGKTKFTHLYIPKNFDCQLNLIPGVENCLSEIEFLSCDTTINDKSLTGLMTICKSIKELELFMGLSDNNFGFARLIKQQKNLFKIRFLPSKVYPIYYPCDDQFYDLIENSLIKHADTIEYLKTPRHFNTKIISSFINLKILVMNNHYMNWKFLWDQNLSFPNLEILNVSRFPINILVNIIKHARNLIELSIEKIYTIIDNKKIIQAIYQNCPRLKYLKMLIYNINILEFKNILINCQDLNELYVVATEYLWEDLFKILAEFSPTNLYKFKFALMIVMLESLVKFFKLWQGRRPMILEFFTNSSDIKKVMKKYKSKGIVKEYNYEFNSKKDDFWISFR